MPFIYIYYKHFIQQELIQKYRYNDAQKSPKIQKIDIHLSFQRNTIQHKLTITKLISGLELIFGKQVLNIHSKIADTLNNVRIGDLISCSINVCGHDVFEFIEKFIFLIVPKIPNFSGFSFKNISNDSNFNFSTATLLDFPGTNHLFTHTCMVQVNIKIEARTVTEAYTLLNSLKIPFNLKNASVA